MPKLIIVIISIVMLAGASEPELEKPFYEWLPCNCNEPLVMGLSEQHFIVYQMYMSGLEHEYEKCNRRD